MEVNWKGWLYLQEIWWALLTSFELRQCCDLIQIWFGSRAVGLRFAVSCIKAVIIRHESQVRFVKSKSAAAFWFCIAGHGRKALVNFRYGLGWLKLLQLATLLSKCIAVSPAGPCAANWKTLIWSSTAGRRKLPNLGAVSGEIKN